MFLQCSPAALDRIVLTIVQVDHQLANVRLNSFAITPPLLEIVRYGIAGGSALAEADG